MVDDERVDADRIASADDVPENDSLLFTVRGRESSQTERAGDTKEAILLQIDDEIVCWLNYCQHLTHIKLDKGSGVERRDGEILCTNHGAHFEIDTGLCTFGPCEGAYLDELEVKTVDDDVYLVDPDYEFVAIGPEERDRRDLTSTSNVEF